jgi:hypothetical protein
MRKLNTSYEINLDNIIQQSPDKNFDIKMEIQ